MTTAAREALARLEGEFAGDYGPPDEDADVKVIRDALDEADRLREWVKMLEAESENAVPFDKLPTFEEVQAVLEEAVGPHIKTPSHGKVELTGEQAIVLIRKVFEWRDRVEGMEAALLRIESSAWMEAASEEHFREGIYQRRERRGGVSRIDKGSWATPTPYHPGSPETEAARWLASSVRSFLAGRSPASAIDEAVEGWLQVRRIWNEP